MSCHSPAAPRGETARAWNPDSSAGQVPQLGRQAPAARASRAISCAEAVAPVQHGLQPVPAGGKKAVDVPVNDILVRKGDGEHLRGLVALQRRQRVPGRATGAATPRRGGCATEPRPRQGGAHGRSTPAGSRDSAARTWRMRARGRPAASQLFAEVDARPFPLPVDLGIRREVDLAEVQVPGRRPEVPARGFQRGLAAVGRDVEL